MSDVVITNKKKKVGKLTLVNWFWGYIFIAPVIVGIAIFTVGPVISSFAMSAMDWDGLTAPVFVGLGNFFRIGEDPLIILELVNTLKYAVWTVPISLGLSILIAVLLNSGIKAKDFFRVAYFLPCVTMAVAVATVWKYLFNSQFGVINYLFRPFGISPQWLGDPQYIMPALIVVAIWSGIGYSIIVLLAGLQGIPKTYFEAAEIDGASPVGQFFHITLPLVSPTIFFLLITGMMGAFKAFDLIFMFAGGAGTGGAATDAIRTMAFGIYTRGFRLMQMGYASAGAVLLFVIIMLITLVQLKLQKKFVFYD